MRCLNIDPGLDKSGTSVLESLSTPLYLGLIETDKSQNLQARLLHFASELAQLIETWNPDIITCEEYYSFSMMSQGFHTAKVCGVVLAVASTYGIPVKMYSPSSVKALVPKPVKPKLTAEEKRALKALKAEGKSPKTKRWSPTKQMVQSAVNEKLGTSYKFPDNQCHKTDSCALGILWITGVKPLY